MKRSYVSEYLVRGDKTVTGVLSSEVRGRELPSTRTCGSTGWVGTVTTTAVFIHGSTVLGCGSYGSGDPTHVRVCDYGG